MPPLYHSQTSVTIVEPRTTSDSHARQSIFRPRREEPAVTTSTGCRLELASTSITASTTSMSMSMSKSTSESTSESTNKSTSASKFAQAASATSLSHFMAASSESTQRQRSRTVVSDASDLSRMFGGERASTSEIDSDFDSEFDPDCDADCDADADHGYDHDYDCNSEYGCVCDCDSDSCDSTTGAKALNSPSALLDASHGFVLGSCPNSPLSRLAATFASAYASKSTTATATTRPMLPPTTSMKSFRKRTRAVYGVGGAAVGTLLCPVVGTVVGAIGVGCSVNYVLKRRERRVFAKWEKRSVQEQALASVAAVSEHAVKSRTGTGSVPLSTPPTIGNPRANRKHQGRSAEPETTTHYNTTQHNTTRHNAYPVLSCPVLSGTALSCTILSGTALSGTILSGTAPSGTVPREVPECGSHSKEARDAQCLVHCVLWSRCNDERPSDSRPRIVCFRFD